MIPIYVAMIFAMPTAPAVVAVIAVVPGFGGATRLLIAHPENLRRERLIAAPNATRFRLLPVIVRLTYHAHAARRVRRDDSRGALYALHSHALDLLRAGGLLGFSALGAFGAALGATFGTVAIVRLRRLATAISAAAVAVLGQRRHGCRADQKKGNYQFTHLITPDETSPMMMQYSARADERMLNEIKG